MSVRSQWIDRFWMKIMRPRLFRLDAEDAHRRAIELMMRIQDNAPALGLVRLFSQGRHLDQPRRVAGVTWRNPVGIPAGLDKQAEAIPFWDALGFGSCELGTILPVPQEGNPRPRVFRYPEHNAIINCMGFNSDGAERIVERVRVCHRHHPNIKMALGYSLGMNVKTPIECAVDDYLAAFKIVLPVIRPGRDFVQMNVSSPNTAGLRDLIRQLDVFLRSFIQPAKAFAFEESIPMPPLVVKFAPDGLERQEDFDRIAQVCSDLGIAGAEMTNTTVDGGIKKHYGFTEAGGLSGFPLYDRSFQYQNCLNRAKNTCRARFDTIAVGGIGSADMAMQRLRADAAACQVFTGFVFRGPGLKDEILRAVKEDAIMQADAA